MKVFELKEKFWQSAECEFWDIILSTLLEQTLWKENDNESPVVFKDNEYSEFLEDCVIWAFPNMKKEIVRESNGKIAEILFLIEGITVITLKNYNVTYHINILNNWYSFSSKEMLSERLYEFLQAFPIFYSEGVSEYYSFSRNIKKQYKLRQIAQDSIRIVIDKIMTDNGYLYLLKFKEKSCLLKVKMKKTMVLEISLPYKTFANRLDKIIETIKLVEQTIENSKMRFYLSGYGYYVDWKSDER